MVFCLFAVCYVVNVIIEKGEEILIGFATFPRYDLSYGLGVAEETVAEIYIRRADLEVVRDLLNKEPTMLTFLYELHTLGYIEIAGKSTNWLNYVIL